MGIKDKYSSVFRYLLITLNTFLAILCIAVIGFELWIRFDVNFETQTRENLLNINRNPIDYFNVKEQIRTAVWFLIRFKQRFIDSCFVLDNCCILYRNSRYKSTRNMYSNGSKPNQLYILSSNHGNISHFRGWNWNFYYGFQIKCEFLKFNTIILVL
jgi:hypothetical protein